MPSIMFDIKDVLPKAQLDAIYEEARVGLWNAWALKVGFDFRRGDVLHVPVGHNVMRCVPAVMRAQVIENPNVTEPVFVRSLNA